MGAVQLVRRCTQDGKRATTPPRVSTTLDDSQCHVTPAAPQTNQQGDRTRDSAHDMGAVQLLPFT
ncbi:hypothetical protein K443DRAFT_10491 [Laccaria amethystina LaAM-08-1]|uniref:Uncharacterized protein n=1 Tax=Laccaria amethystina LaAM-08-1 TaxID=1095629 RepID=A0A0C9XG30_9AGAR|nr:hypothetical protein K443DRAFT_10491 [Laccaria amethystina LaAM-08-1]